MNGPKTLARALAARVDALPAAVDANDNPPVPAAVVAAAFEALAAGRTHYTDRPGILPLRERIVELLGRRYRLAISADQVTITCGATEARFVAVKQLVPPGSRLVCAGNGDSVRAAAHLAGVDIVYEGPPPAVSAAYLTPLDDRTHVDELLDMARRTNWWVIWDMSGGDPRDHFHPAQVTELVSRVVSIGSFSGRLPGWRVGWMAGSAAASRLRAYKQSLTICTTSISQWAALGLEEG